MTTHAEYPATVAVEEIEPLATVPFADVVPFDVEAIRADFPILERTVDGRPLVYLDSANTSQKPRCAAGLKRLTHPKSRNVTVPSSWKR